MKIGSMNRKALLVLLLCALVSAFASDTKDVIKNARASYYSLKDQGLKSFTCEVTPDWRKFLESATHKSLSADDPVLKKFEGLRFTVAIDEKGNPTVTPLMADGSAIPPNLDEMISGFKEMISGFYEMWTPLVLTNPFNGEQEGLTIKQEGDSFHLFGEGVNAGMFLDKDYVITKMNTSSEGSKIVLFPVFEKTAKGLLLTSVKGDINEGAQKLQADIQYREIQGLQLPNTVAFNVVIPSQPILIDLAFSKYQIVKK